MNYLKMNLHYSQSLPYDVMMLITDYAQPLFLEQIENGDYDFDEIMYKRMMKHIKSQYLLYQTFWELSFNKYEMLNKERWGYKILFLKGHQSNTPICGLFDYNYETKKMLMLEDLKTAGIIKAKKINYNKYKMKNVFKKWLKL